MSYLYCNTTRHDRFHSCWKEPPVSFQILVTSLSALFIVVGVTGNILVLAAILLVPRLRTFSNAFIANLAVADLGALFTGFTTLLLGLHRGEILQGNTWICQLLLNLTCHFIFTSITTLQIIAVDRFLIITKFRPVYNMYYKGWRIWALVGGTWMVGFAMAGFSLFSSFVCRDAYMEPLHTCYIDISNPVSMACFTAALFLSCFLCLFTVPLFYVLTFREIRIARQRIKQHSSAQSPPSNTGRSPPGAGITLSTEELVVTRMVAIVYFTYVLCWSPMLFTHLNYFGERCPNYVTHYICSLLALINSSLNPLIYTGVNRTFRRSCLEVLKRKQQSESTVASIAMNFT